MTTPRNILRAIAATPWAIQEEKLHAIMEFLELRARGGRVSAEDVAKIKAARRDPVVRSAGKVAVLPLYGVIAQRMNFFTEFSGGTSTEKFGAMFAEVLDRSDVDAIVIDIDSPGGSVEGVPELAAQIFAGRGKKPIVAVANSLMASAAYWIGSAADEIVATPMAHVGSIGVFTVHTDMSQALADEGLRLTTISAGKYKTEGNAYEPLSAEGKEHIQGVVDDIYGIFTSDVAKHRKVSAGAVREGYGQGRALLGRSAIAAGLADRIGTLDDVVAQFATGKGKASRASALANARRNRAGEELIPADRAAAIAPMTNPLLSLGFEAAAPHNGQFLLVDGTSATAVAMDGDEDDDLCDTCGAALDDAGDCPKGHPQDPDNLDDDEDDPPDNQAHQHSQRSAEGAASRRTPIPPIRQAPEPAKEQTVSGAATAPEPGVSATDQMALIDLAAAHEKSPADVQAWMKAGKTPHEVQAEILAEYRAKARPVVTVTKDPADHDFKSLGEQLVAIVAAGRPGGRIDPRLARFGPRGIMAGIGQGMNEGVGSEGGFYIQPETLPGALEPVYNDDPVLSRVQRVPIGATSNSLKMNVVDESSRASGSRWGGISMGWMGEADSLTKSKPKLRVMELSLKKLGGLAYLTDEQMQDAPATESLITSAFQAEWAFMLAAGIWGGSGVGQPLGILNSGALVTVAIESGQTIANTAASISLNVTKMLARIPGPLWSRMIWLYNQDLLPKLMNATIGTGGAAIPAFIAAGGLTGRNFDTILGRPAFTSEIASAEGTVGDLIAVVPDQYMVADKGGPQQAYSMHVAFLTDEGALRIIYRVDGQPIWRQAVTPFKGSARSPYVALATRS